MRFHLPKPLHGWRQLAGEIGIIVVGVLIALASLWRKLRFEERWMRERFGEQYAAYARRVPALVPLMR